MEETIQAGYGEAVGGHTNRAAGFCALLGMVLLLNQGGTGAEGMARDEQEIAGVESSDLANQIKGGGLSGQNEILKDAETLVLKMLSLQDRGEGNLRLSEAIPEPSLRLPELSDGGTVWEAVQEQTDRMPGDRAADFSMSGGSACQTEPGISGAGEGNELLRQAAPGDTADAGMEMNPAASSGEGAAVEKPVVPESFPNVGNTVEPMVPEMPSDTGNTVEPMVPEMPSDTGNTVEPIVPEVPSDIESSVKPTVPEAPSDIGNTVEPIVPEAPSDTGNTVEPIVPETPSDIGNTVEPIVPETPSDIESSVKPTVPGASSDTGNTVEPIVPETPSDTGNTVDPIAPDMPSDIGSSEKPIVPDIPADIEDVKDPSQPDQDSSLSTGDDDAAADTGAGENQDQDAPSCFLLDEMGMLCGFLPEYAEIADGCLTLPAECTGIRSGAFSGSGAGIVELYIPAGAAVVEEGALSGLVSLEWIDVEPGNPGCTGDCGVLFDSTGTVLLAFPAAWMDVYAVPPCVTRIAGRAFEGTSIYRLDIRDCMGLTFGEQVFGASGGNGIQVAVPEQELELYTDMLAGYAVTVTK